VGATLTPQLYASAQLRITPLTTRFQEHEGKEGFHAAYMTLTFAWMVIWRLSEAFNWLQLVFVAGHIRHN
jgi:hypothetical protein